MALNGSYRTPWTTLNGGYSRGEGYRQSGIGASRTMIAHSGGVVLSPESGSTMALIEAKDAAGAMLPGSPGHPCGQQWLRHPAVSAPVPD